MVRPALILPPYPDDRWELAKQMGVTDAVIHPLEIGDDQTYWAYDELRGLRNYLEGDGLNFSVLEGSVPSVIASVSALTDATRTSPSSSSFFVTVATWASPLSATTGWVASAGHGRRPTTNSAGIALDGLRQREDAGRPDHLGLEKTHEDIFEALAYFLEEVVPVAEESGVKLGLHPDDPPRESVRDVPRIANSVANYDRILDVYDSEYNGVTFCQGNFAAMGADIPDTIRHFGEKINFVHFRDVNGDVDRFVETWHDDGPTDMHAAMEAYVEAVDDDVPMRPDHVPTMAGEDNSNPGYHFKGRLFAIGYMRGLLDSLE